MFYLHSTDMKTVTRQRSLSRMAEEGPNHVSWAPTLCSRPTALSPGLPQDSSDSVTAIV